LFTVEKSLFCTKGSADGRACARPDRGFFDDTESFHKLVEFLTCHLLDFLRIPWPLEVPVFDTLVKEQVSITFPDKFFDTVAPATTEKEQGAISRY
jgi:hypothetical protein